MKSDKIAIASDHGGFKLKKAIIEYLTVKKYEFEDFGTYSEESCDYPVIAKTVIHKILNAEFQRAILICGTGQGMAMAANRFAGIRAAVCTNTFTARAAREHNDSNILCLGERVTTPYVAFDICDVWLNASFEGGRHKKRVNLIEHS